MGELSPEVVGIENFDEGELDQYLPPNGHHHGHLVPRGTMPPPPPYASSGATPSSMASQSWANAYRNMNGNGNASGMLHRIASTGSQSGDSPTDNNSCLSPNGNTQETHSNDVGYQGNMTAHQNAVYDANRNMATDTTNAHSQNVKMESSSQLQQHYSQQRDPKMNSYDLQMSHAYSYTGSGPTDAMTSDYSNLAAASHQYYMPSSGQTAGPPYQCMATGIRPLYLGANPVTVNGSAQWNKYGQP